MKGTTILGVVILIMLISIVFVPDLGILILLGLLIGGAFYYSRRKCAKCGKRGTIVVSQSSDRGSRPSSRSSRSHSPLRLELMNLRSSRGSSRTQ